MAGLDIRLEARQAVIPYVTAQLQALELRDQTVVCPPAREAFDGRDRLEHGFGRCVNWNPLLVIDANARRRD